MGRRSALALAVVSALLCQVGGRAGLLRGGGRGAGQADQLSIPKRLRQLRPRELPGSGRLRTGAAVRSASAS